jgi:hypothetical protein
LFEVLESIVEGDAVLFQEGMGFHAGCEPKPPLKLALTDEPFPIGFQREAFQDTPGKIVSPMFMKGCIYLVRDFDCSHRLLLSLQYIRIISTASPAPPLSSS